MKRMMILALLAVFLLSILGPTALALEVCYPTSIEQSDDGSEIRKTYDLGLEDDPGGIPRSDFEQNGWNYSLTDLLKQETPEYQEREHTETVTVTSKKKDMESVLALLPQEKETTTEDGFTGTLHLVLDSIKTEPAGYGSSTKPVTATRSYPNLASADANHLPKTITEGGRTLKLQDIQWQTDNTYNADDYEIGDRFTAICTYGGSKSVSYVTGYTTTANYTGEVYRTGVTFIRYTVIFTGTPIASVDPEPVAKEEQPQAGAGWPVMTVLGLAALAAGAGGTYFVMKRKERMSYEETADDGRGGADAQHGDGHDGHGAGV